VTRLVVKNREALSRRRMLGLVVSVRTATPEDLAIVAETAARAFDGEAMLRWSFAEDRFQERLRRHFTHYDGENIRHGWVRMTADGAGIAVWVPPDAREEFEAIGPAPAGQEEEMLGGNAERRAAFWGWVEEHEPAEPFLYLSHIGVVPERQGQGLGAVLMRDGLDQGDRLGVPIWLETSRVGNVHFYGSFGFRTAVEEDAPEGGPHLWFMRRDSA
jgi:ribosomal protein S18 acetylase RimI-like enzyme